jgi:hypothetical protein
MDYAFFCLKVKVGSSDWRPLSVVDAAGGMGVGISAPAGRIHLKGGEAWSRMDRDRNSPPFILVRTSVGDFSTVWKTLYVGVDASGVNNGSLFITTCHRRHFDIRRHRHYI